MSNKSGLSNQVISLPKGGGALQGIGEKFAPDLHTGTGNFTVPIALPPGRNGFQPQLNLVYSTGTGNSPYGLGWSLSIPGVSRKTSKGLPRYDDSTDVFVLSGAEDLVPVEAQAWMTRYRPRTEGLFACILHHHGPDNDYWEVRSKDGLASFYGTPKPSNAAPDWTDPAVIRDPDPLKSHHLFAWKLTRTVDPFGNRIDYLYERDAVHTEGPHQWDQLYLSEIRYVDYGDPAAPQFLVTVRFFYEDRCDRFSDYRAGFEMRTVRRCTRIDISTHTNADVLTRSYHLIYLNQCGLPAEQLPHNGVSLLHQITVIGHDGALAEELPPLEFGYTRFEPDRRDFFPITGTALPPGSLARPDYEQADLFGNGLPDILEMNGTVRYWRNLGNGTFDLPREMRDAPAGLRLADSGVQLVDADGDGRIDLLVTTEAMSGYFPLRFGGLWDRRSFRRYTAAPSFNLEDPEVKLVDLDGDGVTDVIRAGSRLECFFNDPKEGWTRTRWVERTALDEFPVNFSDPRVKWGDMSGDGLQDIVLVHNGSVDYWPNLGYGDWGQRIHMRYSPRFPEGYNPRRILVGDVDGDGLADIVYVDDTKITLWINQSGNAWSDPIVIKGTPPVSDMDAVRLSDMLGSGISGVLWSADFNGLSRQHMFFLDFTGGTKPYLLNEMDNHIGAITRVTYASSTRFYLVDQKKLETRWKTPLPFPVQVVARVEAIDELSKGKLTTAYRYHHGYWDGVEREFRGFGMVEQFDSEEFEAGPTLAAPSYNFSTIDVPGATSTVLFGINEKGQIVGAQRDATGLFHSMLTDTHSFSTFDPLGFPGGSQEISVATGINVQGEIVGAVLKNDIPNPESQAYVKCGSSFSLYNHPNAAPSKGTTFGGINDAGVRVGTYTDNADTPHGFSQDDNTTTLLESSPSMPANKGTWLFDINNLGQVVDGYFDALRDFQHGLFTDGTTFVTIDVPGSDTTWLNGINDLGQMVGAYFDNATQVFRGFLTAGNKFITIDYPNLPPGFGTFITGIDNSGRIVGYYGAEVGLEGMLGRAALVHGFLATPVSEDAAFRATGGRQHFSPPTCTKTWFHQGPVGDEFGDWAELDLSGEFWSDDAGFLDHKQGVDAFLRALNNRGPDNVVRRMRRDALRALRGSILRTELYAIDGTERADRPYTVTEYVYGLRLEAVAADGEGPAVFFPHHVAQRTTQWERGDDPLTQFTFTDTEDYDAFGQLRRSTSIACPRGWRKLDDLPTEPYFATRTFTTYATPINPDMYMHNRVARATSFELKNKGQLTVEDLHTLPNDSPALEIFGQSYSYYDGPAFEGLPFGQVGSFGALVRTESLVLTEKILHDAYKRGNTILDPPEEPPYLARSGTPPWKDEYPGEFRSLVPVLGGYTFHVGGPDTQDTRGFFVQAERRSYDFQAPNANGKKRGLVTVRRDPLGRDTERDTQIAYDNFELLPVHVTDPAQLNTQATYDYRVLQPKSVTDPNGNQTLFTFTPLGLLQDTFIRGKQEEGDQSQPSISMVYDFLAFQNSKRLDPQNPEPIYVHTTRRIYHDTESDVPLPERDETIESREYSDGFGRLLQTRIQAEDITFGDPIFGGDVLPADQNDESGTRANVVGRQRGPSDPANVVVSGWQIYDNKGRVVEKYEPFYSLGYDYGQPSDTQFGQKTEMFYDPRGQVIRTVNPDSSEQTVIFGVPGTIAAPDLGNPDVFEPTPWEAYTYDADDNAGRTHPIAVARYRHCWDTPTSITIDALGRTVLAIQRNRDPASTGGPLAPIEEIRTTSTYDIRSNLLTVTDALGRPAFIYIYDLANRQLRVENIDAGLRRTVFDAASNAIEYRDSKDALCLHAYDILNRPIRFWARDGTDDALTQREHLIYGDSTDSGFTRALAQDANLLGRLYQHYDEAGRLTCERYDFKGNLQEKIRRVITDQAILSVFTPPPPDWQVQAFRVDWQPAAGGTLAERAAALLDSIEYRTSTTYDALNRLKVLRYPQDVNQERKELRPLYNQAGALEAVALDGSPYVQHIAYNAKGQRVLIVYGNDVMTRYAYDPKTFRLLRLRTERYTQPDPLTYRPRANVLQDFAYEYDLIGNILQLHDRTPESGIPNTQLGTDALDRDFSYNAIYRLLSANGRECDRPPNFPWDDTPRCSDLTRTRAYTETYQYDKVGNILQLQHGANRDFALVAASNRLATMTIGQQNTFNYTYDSNGNLMQETTSRHFEWNHSDRLRVYRTQTGTAEPSVHAHYLYDSGGQRVKKFVRKQSGQVEIVVYIDGIFEYQRIVQGSTMQEHNTLHIMDYPSRIAMLRVGTAFTGDSTPPVKYQLGDHLSSSNIVIGGAGASENDFVNREEYTPYGETSFGSFGRKRYRFSGKERDEESGLYYFGARNYTPWLGRWVSCDPAGTVDGINLYAYTRNNPLTLTDSTGMGTEEGVVTQRMQNPSSPEGPFINSYTFTEPTEITVNITNSKPPRSTNQSSTRSSDEPDIPSQMPHIGSPEPKAPPTAAIGQSDVPTVSTQPTPSDSPSFMQSVNDFREGLLTGMLQGIPVFGLFVKSDTFGRHDKQAYEIGRGFGQIGVGIVDMIIGGGMVWGGGGAALLGLATGPGEAVIGPAGALVVATGAVTAGYGVYSVGTGIQTIAHAMSMRGDKSGGGGGSRTKIEPDWKPHDINDPASRNGCEDIAKQINELIGGKIHRVRPLGKAPTLGGYRGKNWGWTHHDVVVKEGRVYDAFTGSKGLSIEEYINLWEYPEAIHFGF